MNLKHLVAAVALIALSLPTQAGIIIEVSDDAGNLVFDYSGTLNLDTTTGSIDRSVHYDDFYRTTNQGSLHSYFAIGDVTDYELPNFTSTSNSAVGGINLYNGALTGDALLVDFWGTTGQIWLDKSYVSGEQLSGSATFSGVSIADAGWSIGDSWTWEWEQNGIEEFLTLSVGSTNNSVAVPEPSALVVFGLALMGLASRGRKKQA